MAKKQDNIKILEEKLAHLEDQLKRAVADYHNLERRVAEDSLSVVHYSKGLLVAKLLPVLDNLDQAVAGASQSEAQSGWLKGVLMSIKELRQVLSDEGLVEIEASGNFDPLLHEAVDTREPSSAEASAGKGENSILEIVQRGYTLNGKILRPVKVVVGKKNPEKVSEEAKEEVETEES